MKDLHYLLRLHDLFEAMVEGVQGQEVEEVRLAGEVHLQEAKRAALGQAFAVHPQDGFRLTLHDSIGNLSHLLRGSDDHVFLMSVKDTRREYWGAPILLGLHDCSR